MKRNRSLGLFLVGLAAFTFWTLGYRSADGSELADVLARHRAAGLGSGLDDLVAGLPEVDRDLQERAWAWLTRPRAPGESYLNHDRRWYLDGKDGPSESERTRIGRFAPEGERLIALLASGRLVLSSAGWFAADAPRLAATRVGERMARFPGPSLTEAACWLGARALMERGGAPLDALDLLARAVSPVALTIDAAHGSYVRLRRDEIYLTLALGGDLPNDRLRAWAAEESDAAAAWADAERGERLLRTTALAHDLLAGRSLVPEFDSGDLTGLRGLQRMWERAVVGPRRWPVDCVHLLEYQAAVEGFLRGAGSVSDVERTRLAAQKNVWPFELPNEWPSVRLVVMSDRAAHRACRAAALLVASARREGGLPETVAEARGRLGPRANLLDAGDWDFGLSYRRLARDRFRIALDAAETLAPVDERAGLDRPPSTQPLVVRGTSVEVCVR